MTPEKSKFSLGDIDQIGGGGKKSVNNNETIYQKLESFAEIYKM